MADGTTTSTKKREGTRGQKKKMPDTPDEPEGLKNPVISALLARYSLTLIVFFISLFFIISVSNPALFLNDEWISANQLHQLDIGHQVVVNEAKYGVTKNGTISLYFVEGEKNLLSYSLALPITALPITKLFGLFGDNFRVIVILLWSLIPILLCLIIEAGYPRYRKIHGIRLSILGLLFGLFLFLCNTLLYKQFAYSAIDAPYEVAALVLTNHLLFAITAAVIFETSRVIFKDRWMALFCTFACVSCSSFIFWAGAAKDHMAVAAVFAVIIFLFIRYLYESSWLDATLAFAGTGILLWIRPEVGIVVFCCVALFFCILQCRNLIRRTTGVTTTLRSLSAFLGVILGSIPFFINNQMITGNWLVPLWLARPVVTRTENASGVTEAVQSVAPASGTGVSGLASSVFSGISNLQSRLTGLSPDTIHNLTGILLFPENKGIGFFILCPLIVIAIVSAIVWFRTPFKGDERRSFVLLFLILMSVAVFCSYIPEMRGLNTDEGIAPDMRYLSPAYIPLGLLSIMVLRQTPLIKKPQVSLKNCVLGSIILVPAFFFLLVIVHPLGSQFSAYASFFRFVILFEVLLCCALIVMSRVYRETARSLVTFLPYVLVAIIVTVFTFQFMLTFIYGAMVKFNGYPFWIPLVREGYGLFIKVTFLQPV
jgi:hypothetical protein